MNILVSNVKLVRKINVIDLLLKRNFLLKTSHLTITYPFSSSHSVHVVDKNIVESIERLALVDFPTEAGIDRLEKSILFADKLMEVDTTSVEPMINTVYKLNENIRNDVAVKKSYREDLMQIAPINEEFYYVAPLGTFSRKKDSS